MFVRSAAAPLAWLLAFSAAPLAAQQHIELPARDNPLSERPTNVFTVGTEEGESWEMFSGIRALAFDKAENLYVLDGQNFRVLVFDARGKFVRQFGKKGGGPGELQAPLGLAVLADGNVAVSDLANRGYIIYKPTGEYVRNATFPEDGGMPMGRLETDPRGGILTRAGARITRNLGGGPGTPPPELPSGPSFISFVRHNLGSSATSDAVTASLMFKAEVAPPRQVESGANARAFISMQPAFAATPVFGALPDGGIAVHHESEYRIKLLDAAGRHTRTFTRAYPPRKVTKKDQEAELERRKNARANGQGQMVTISTTAGSGGSGTTYSIGGAGARGGGSGTTFSMNLEDIPFAEFMSAVTNLRADPQGRIWVQRRHADGSNQGPIDLVSAAGKYIGTLTPQALPDAFSASGLAAYIVRDDLGVERVAVRRLPASWR